MNIDKLNKLLSESSELELSFQNYLNLSISSSSEKAVETTFDLNHLPIEKS